MITRILLLKKLLVILPFAVVDAGYDYDDFLEAPPDAIDIGEFSEGLLPKSVELAVRIKPQDSH